MGTQRSTVTMESSFCNVNNDALVGYTQNTLILCTVCSTLEEVNRSKCPTTEMCDCQQSMRRALSFQQYQGCSVANALHDDHHIWLSAYLVCLWKDPEELSWVNTGRSSLEAFLRS